MRVSVPTAKRNLESSEHDLIRACKLFGNSPHAQFYENLPELLGKLAAVHENRAALAAARTAEAQASEAEQKAAKDAKECGITPSSQGATEEAKAVAP